MKTALCVSASQMAFWRRKPKPGLPHHSGRGSQYASHEYRKHLAIMKMAQSMGRKGIAGITARQNGFSEGLNMDSRIMNNLGLKHRPN